MDLKDRKILYELDKNGRATYSEISKATKLPQETVRYRISSLINEGTIQKVLTLVNTAQLGYSYYQILLKLQNVNAEKQNSNITYLNHHKNVAWIGELEGNYDIAFILYVRNQVELQNITHEFYEKFSKYILKKTFSTILSSEFFQRDYLIEKEHNPTKKRAYETYETPITLDKTDSAICKLLTQDGRMPAVEIGKQLKLSPDAIIRRIKNLQKEKILLGSTIVLNQEKIGQLHYKIQLYLNNISKEKETSLLAFCRNNNRTIAIVRTLAEWDYEVDIEIENVNQLKQFTMQLTEKYSEIIKDYNLLRVVSMPKYQFYTE